VIPLILRMISAGAAMMGRQKPFDTCRMDDRAFPRQITRAELNMVSGFD
jgi:hypothetical protein